MSEFRQRAIEDVARACGKTTAVILLRLERPVEAMTAYAVAQRERVLGLEAELRQERGLKALLANGNPPTGNPDFDKVLATHPIAAMIQRGWLGGITGFDDLPALESAICHFYGVKAIAEAMNPGLWASAQPRPTHEA